MNRGMICLAAMLALCVLLGSGVGAAPAAAAPVEPQDTGVYEEDFSAYTYKDYVENAKWDIWGNALRLARMDAIDQSHPAVAAAESGSAIVVWADTRNSNDDIYAQKLDARGNTLWATDVRVNSDTEMKYQRNPAVAVDGSGNAIVVWVDYRNYNGDIYAQKLDGSGNKLWIADVCVNSGSWTADQDDPAVAMDGDGNAIIVWEDPRNGDFDIYAQKLDGSGNKLWVTDARVNSDSGTTDQESPAVAMDSDENAIIVWEDPRNGDSDVYAQKLDGSGNRLWTADTRVNSDNGTADQRDPAVAVGQSRDAVVVWQDWRTDNRNIYAQKLNVGGNRAWMADVQVSSDGGTEDQYSPAVGGDESGNAVVAWDEWRSGNHDIYAQKLDGSGNRQWVTDTRVNSDSGMDVQLFPAVAINVGGDAFVVWQDEHNGDPDVYTQKLDGSGDRLWTTDTRVNCDSGTVTQWNPAVARDGSGNAVVVWEDWRSGNPGIYAHKLDASGNVLWVADVRVNSDGKAAYQQEPAVAMDGSGNAIVAWQECRNGGFNIYAQKLDGSGNKLWTADVRVSSDIGTANQYDPTVAVDGDGNIVVVWHDYRSGYGDIYAQKLDGSGNRLWAADTRVNSDSGTVTQWDPTVATDGGGNAVVVWYDERSGDFDIYAQRLDSDGNRLWSTDVRVNSDIGTTRQRNPSVAVGISGNAIVLWEDERSGSQDRIYAQELDESGNKLWAADVRVNSDIETANQHDPAVASDGSGNAIVVWVDYRNAWGDIYAQKLDGSGNRLWTADVRVNSDSGTAQQQSPAVAVDRGGNAAVVWTDEHNGNSDVYAQRINSVGSRAWLADLQVVYPDLFYFATGVAQSRTVDSVAGAIRSATLTAGYQVNGGAVQFQLTNDGGTHWAVVSPGITHVFTTTGSDLRWRVVLTGDPLWRHRAPVVNSLRVEYSTQAPPADDYEPDDTCIQASLLQVNGAAQAHAFHQHADGDWTWFEAITGTAYLVQAVHAGPNADLELELYDACSQPPLPPDDEDTFGNDARLVFTAPTADVYYVKAANHAPAVYGEDTGYLLSVRTQSPAPLVTIVAGRNEVNQLVDKIIFMGDQAYRTFRRAGVPRENIRYLGIGVNRDPDQDGHLDVDGQPTWENVRYAVQDWPRERGVRLGVPFYLYLTDHGGTDYYCAQGCAAGKRVTAADLNLWLSNLEATSGLDEINVIIDACFSGSFIDVTDYGPAEISSPGRLVIASTGSRARAFPSERGGYFSDAFFTALGDNADLWTAYEAGRTAAQAAWGEQMPWLDDNGDAVADGRDGLIARGRGLASFGGGAIPVVDWLRVGEVSESGVATITAQVRDDVAVMTVTVEVYPPGLTVPETGEGETPVLPVERVVLQDGDHDGVYAGTHTGFTEEGVYRLVAYAWDNDGNLSLPRQATVGERRVFLPLVMRGN